MPAKRVHEHADEIRRLIEQLGRWSGDIGRSTSPLAWIGDFIRRRPSEFGPSIPLLAGEALDTMRAMQRMPNALRSALDVYYTRPGREEDQLRFLNRRKRSDKRITLRTYQWHVKLAHDRFWLEYVELRKMATAVGTRNNTTLPPLERPPEVAGPRERPQHGRCVKVAGDGVKP